MKKIIILSLVLLSLIIPVGFARGDEVCAVYFTGIGCTHCARADPLVLEQMPEKYPNFIIIEYELYHQYAYNAQLISYYNSQYSSGLGIPLIILGKDEYIGGDLPILDNLERIIENKESNPCPLSDGSSISFNNLNINTIPGRPKIWFQNRILLKTSDSSSDSQLLKDLLLEDNVSVVLSDKTYEIVEPYPVLLSGKNVLFDNAIEINGWLFQWNGSPLEIITTTTIGTTIEQTTTTVNNITTTTISSNENDLTFAKIVSLGAVDAVNPCALAVLTLMLIAIITYNPKNKKNVLLAGLAFTCSVFIMYFFYGLILIKLFKLIEALTVVRVMFYKILGSLAIILGLLQIKDFFQYKPGGIATEMPMGLRPKVKKIISGVTSPKGAFGVGLFVTLFLLPCTIGPYIIASGILSTFDIIRTIPWLFLYNLIFIIPMVAITLFVYMGIAKVDDISGWKDKNIRKLHLIAGIIILILGVAMVMGWV